MSPGAGPAAAAGGTAGLLTDLAVRQGLLQFGDVRVGDLGVGEASCLQVAQILEMHQPRVSDLGTVEAECFQVGHFP